MATEYQLMKDYADLGEKLGFEGTGLQSFIDGLLTQERNRRAEVREAEKEAREAEKQARAAEAENLRMQLQIEQLRSQRANADSSTVVTSVVPKPKLPKFDECVDDVDAYLDRFERFATSNQWPRDNWANNLSPLLTGKALQAYVSLSVADSNDYDVVKKNILLRYSLTEEGYRQKFRDTCPERSETVVQFSSRMCLYFERWIDIAGISKEYGDLKDLILREQFLRKCKPDLRMFLKERTPKSLKDMISLTEQYMAAHGGSMWIAVKTQKNKSEMRESSPSKQERVSSYVSQDAKGERLCFLCHKPGHLAKNCPTFVKAQKSKKTEDKTAACVEQRNAELIQQSIPSLASSGVISEGLTPNIGYIGNRRVDVLRDNGCTGVIVREELVSREQFTGDVKRCLLIDNTVRICPVAKIFVNTPYYIGEVEASCMKNPIYDLIIGNIAGVSDKPCEVCLDYNISGITEVKNVIKSGDNVHKLPLENVNVTDKSTAPVYSSNNENNNVILGSSESIINDEQVTVEQDELPFAMVLPDMNSVDYEIVGAVETRSKKRVKSLRALNVEKDSNYNIDPITPNEQEADISIMKFLQHCKLSKDSCTTVVKHKGLWYRQIEKQEGTLKQLLVPLSRRVKILRLAHESLMGGHMGINKTVNRILTCFYWPGLVSDVKKWCRTCDVCQRTIPKGRVSKIPLGKMPLMSSPFQTVAIDLVGPITPMSSQGNRYIMTYVDYATRWPEAIPLPDITTERVADALIGIFSRLGFPSEILSDRGSQFTSTLMNEICRLINVKQSFTTPYHPMSNGLNERFNGTLKSLLKKMCRDRPNDWDRYVNAVLFAYREMPHASTGFSPFELLYGRKVKGPLGILRDLWIGEVEQGEVHNTYTYVMELRNKLEETCE